MRVKVIGNSLLQESNLVFYLLFVVTSLITCYLIQTTYFTEDVFYNTFAEQITYERVHKIFEMGAKYRIINYLVIPLIFILKVLYNSLWISIGTFFKTGKDMFGSNFSLCLKSEIVFLIMNLVNLIYIFFFKEINTLNDLNPVPFSLLEVFKNQTIQPWLKYPLQTANPWELAYCLVGSYLYSVKYSLSFRDSLRMFALPYISGLLILVIFVMFFILQMA